MSRRTPLVEEFLARGIVPECPVIDMHTHPDANHAIYFPDNTPEGILRTMDRCGVRTLAIAPHDALVDAPYGNAKSLAMHRAHPERFLVYWCFNPNFPELTEEAKDAVLTQPGVIGYKFLPPYHHYPLTGPNYQPLFAHAHAYKRIVLTHTWRDPTCDAASIRWLAERYPEMRLLMGHSCWDDFDGAFALARDFPHVYLELTACERMPAFIDRAVREVGAHKLVYGTDLPWFDPFFSIGCVLFADIDDDDRHAILHGNAEWLLAQQKEHRLDYSPAGY